MDPVSGDAPQPASGGLADDARSRDRAELPAFLVVAGFCVLVAAWWFLLGPEQYEARNRARSGTAAGVLWTVLAVGAGVLAALRSRLPVRPDGVRARRRPDRLPTPEEGHRTTLRWAAVVTAVPLGALLVGLGVDAGWEVVGGRRAPMPGYGLAVWGALVATAGVAVFRRLRPRS